MDKTLVVGLDAACWEYLAPLLQAGRLPTLQKLMDTGIRGTLNSTMPAITPAAWSSIVTGKNPGKHGVFDMLWREPGGYGFTPTSAHIRQGTPFWQYLNHAGVRVGLINVPFTHPPAPVNGFLICGFGTPETVRDLTWPPEALPWAESQYGRYEPTVPTDLLRNGTPEEILAAEMHHQTHLIEIGLGLAEQYPVEVLVINLMLTDHANHKMPRMELLHEAYLQADADLARLLTGFQPDNVLLISDHGSSRLKGDFLLNMWLRDHGYCVYLENTPGQQKSVLTWVLKQWFQEHLGWSGFHERGLRRLLRFVLPRLPKAVQQRFWREIETVIPFAETHMRMSSKPDFSRTTVYPGSLYSGVLYFNVAGREPNGILTAHARKALAAKLKDELSKIQDPETGKPLFTNVFSADELYHGAAADHAPDIVVDAYGSPWNIRTRQPATFKAHRYNPPYFVAFDQKRDYGWHSPHGIFVFSGPAFQSGQASDDYLLLDVPATLLHLYDVPLPADWDSRVLHDLLTPELSQRPSRQQPGDPETGTVYKSALSHEEADSLANHLRALGYL